MGEVRSEQGQDSIFRWGFMETSTRAEPHVHITDTPNQGSAKRNGDGMPERKPGVSVVYCVLVWLVLVLATPAVSTQEPLTFAVIGDSGAPGRAQQQVASQMKNYYDNRHRFEFVLLLGDNIYPDGIGRGLKAHFEEPYAPLLGAGVKFYAALGNHDIRKGTETQINYDKFNMGGRRYYSFVKGDGLIEFFALDSTVLSGDAKELEQIQVAQLEREKLAINADGRITQQERKRLEKLDPELDESRAFIQEHTSLAESQFAWLKEAMSKSQARWKVVFMHHSIYSSARRHGNSKGVLQLRALLEPILVQNRVDAVFAGHDHTYERAKPQPAQSSDGHRVYHFTQGASSKLRRGNLNTGSPYFARGEDRKNSFLVVRVTNGEMEVEAIGSDGDIIDSYEIVKKGQ
jgi:predicted phosphodiesterase